MGFNDDYSGAKLAQKQRSKQLKISRKKRAAFFRYLMWAAIVLICLILLTWEVSPQTVDVPVLEKFSIITDAGDTVGTGVLKQSNHAIKIVDSMAFK